MNKGTSISEFLKKHNMSKLENIQFIIKGSYDDKESKKLLVDFAIINIYLQYISF